MQSLSGIPSIKRKRDALKNANARTNSLLLMVIYLGLFGCGDGGGNGTVPTASQLRAKNLSYSTPCAENDNVYIVFRGDVSGYRIKATHPTYAVTDYTLWEDQTNCEGSPAYEKWSFEPRSNKMFDGQYSKDTVWVHREASWWRPQGMDVTVDGNQAARETNIHRIVLARYVPSSAGEWPEFLVLYSDGYLRLIPFPPAGQPLVSYGSSVIVGRIEEVSSIDGTESRPVAAIQSVDYRISQKQLVIQYRNGESATIDIESVTRSKSILKVTMIAYATDEPCCTIRSNYVSANRCDTSTVIWEDKDGATYTSDIISFADGVGWNWSFTRQSPSVTRNSSPDITITFF
jgi:hypothetical protein